MREKTRPVGASAQAAPVAQVINAIMALSSEQSAVILSHEAWLDKGQPKNDPRCKRAVLRGDWRWADLRERRLKRADCRHADLNHADFAGAWLDETDFGEAELRHAKLKDSKGLSIDSLGGTDLNSAELPEGMYDFPALKAVEQLSSYLQSLFKIVVALSVFNVLTVLSFRDDQILLHSGGGTTQVPLLNAAISPGMFATVVPLIILVLQVYFSVYASYLWKDLATLPAIFPDGAALDRRTSSTLFNSYIRLHLTHLKEHWSDWFQAMVSSFLGFCIAPAAILCSWIVFLSRHDMTITIIQSVLFTMSTGLCGFCVISARPTLRDSWPRWLSRHGHRAWWVAFQTVMVVVLVGAVVTLAFLQHLYALPPTAFFIRHLDTISWIWLIVWGVGFMIFSALIVLTWYRPTEYRFRPARPIVVVLCFALMVPELLFMVTAAEPVFDSKNPTILVADYFTEKLDTKGDRIFPGLLIPEPYPAKAGRFRHRIAAMMKPVFGKVPFLDVSGKEISARPSHWVGKIETETADLNGVVGADLEGADLRSIDANRVFLVRANLHGAWLTHANLRNADLRGVDLRESRLNGAILRNANLKGAWMDGADLTDSLLGGDDPLEPNQEGKANLQDARLEGVICVPYMHLRDSRNYALAYYGVRDGREVNRYRQARGFDLLDASAPPDYRKALANLTQIPDDPKVIARYLIELLKVQKVLTNTKMLTPKDLCNPDGFTNQVAAFVARNDKNVERLKCLGLKFRTDDQVLNRQFADYCFAGMNLREADLRKADLRCASFEGAVLNAAQFQDADLRGADFTDADLRGANLQRAKLEGAIFEDANLLGADLTDTIPHPASLVLTLDQRKSAITKVDPATAGKGER